VGILGFTASQGSTLTVNGNGDHRGGIIIAGALLSIFGGDSGSGANIIAAAHNAAAGIFVSAGVIANPEGTGQLVLQNNATGLSFINDAKAIIRGGLNVQNNGTGVLADGVGSVTLISMLWITGQYFP
jgi:hypothetical protein